MEITPKHLLAVPFELGAPWNCLRSWTVCLAFIGANPYNQPMRLAACLLLAATLITGVFAQEFKGVTYKKPVGWDEAVQGDAKVFAPKGLKEGEVLAVIMTGAVPTNGSSWEKQFAETIALANDGGKSSNESKVEKREVTGAILLVQSMGLDHKQIGKHSRLYAQVSLGEQRVFVTVISNKDALLEKHAEAVMELIGSLAFKSANSTQPATSTAPANGRIPTGNTPDSYLGSVGWLPSGKGVPIPRPDVVNGKPVGLWWKFTYDPSALRTKAVVHIYLPDGTRASNPRLGGGMLYDLAGQRAQKGTTGVGTFVISGGQMVERYDGFESKGAFVVGTSGGAMHFKIGGAVFYQLLPMSSQSILGQWKGPGVEYKFKADGTYETGMAQSNGDWAITGFNTGTYILDGYLILLQPKDAPSFVSIVGRAGTELILGKTFYSKR